ncbi:FGGY-family carbohydrate kinase [Synechococcus sp. CCY9202]|uniref:FGGY-family carbohydrate kinase n=1 Tax=Synechococcus sp. CCY9202 TaxID=174698 RepID=UPI002B1FD8B2|nr:FGGY-family carbohydrate kinase [Synechococcus sp. CCY9202]MEA5422382.1 FGGY-family carbohydrate kinase [Synechococcus sp. CCY9202]
MGVDLGSSGLRIALIDGAGQRQADESCAYPAPFPDPGGWRSGLIALVNRLPRPWRQRIGAIAVDGTSGTLLLCHPDGEPPAGQLGQALPYHQACPDKAAESATLAADCQAAASPSGSLARALRLMDHAAAAGYGPADLWLRHQADWLMGWLLNDWRWGEEGNNLRLGWLLPDSATGDGHWAGAIRQQAWSPALPQIRPSGTGLGPLAPASAAALDLPASCLVIAGSTDSNAGVLAADPAPDDGITVLGTTLVLKQFSAVPVRAPGVSCHRLAGRWLVGGASNAGAGILRRFFDDATIEALSRQIDPGRPSGLDLLPLPGTGERFPVDDPDLRPRLDPRPVSDALYLQALLEGLTAIERAGWQRLATLGLPPVRRVITLGGGARNPQWRALRQQRLGRTVLNRPALSAALGMARLARQGLRLGPSPTDSP